MPLTSNQPIDGRTHSSEYRNNSFSSLLSRLHLHSKVMCTINADVTCKGLIMLAVVQKDKADT